MLPASGIFVGALRLGGLQSFAPLRRRGSVVDDLLFAPGGVLAVLEEKKAPTSKLFVLTKACYGLKGLSVRGWPELESLQYHAGACFFVAVVPPFLFGSLCNPV